MKKSWLAKNKIWLIIITVLIVVIFILVLYYVSNNDPSVNLVTTELSSKEGIIKNLLEDYQENDNVVTEVVTDEIKLSSLDGTEDFIDITPKIPRFFIRDSQTEYSSLESSGIKRSKPEKICKKTLERVYGKPFPRVHPNWLVNPKTNRRLELDCYNEELGIAVEYQGKFHTVWPSWPKMSKQEFLELVERDRIKLQLCNQRGVYLIRVWHNVPYELIPDYIKYYLPHNVKKRQLLGLDEYS